MSERSFWLRLTLSLTFFGFSGLTLATQLYAASASPDARLGTPLFVFSDGGPSVYAPWKFLTWLLSDAPVAASATTLSVLVCAIGLILGVVVARFATSRVESPQPSGTNNQSLAHVSHAVHLNEAERLQISATPLPFTGDSKAADPSKDDSQDPSPTVVVDPAIHSTPAAKTLIGRPEPRRMVVSNAPQNPFDAITRRASERPEMAHDANEGPIDVADLFTAPTEQLDRDALRDIAAMDAPGNDFDSPTGSYDLSRPTQRVVSEKLEDIRRMLVSEDDDA